MKTLCTNDGVPPIIVIELIPEAATEAVAKPGNVSAEYGVVELASSVPVPFAPENA
jgi:hypothetical protein